MTGLFNQFVSFNFSEIFCSSDICFVRNFVSLLYIMFLFDISPGVLEPCLSHFVDMLSVVPLLRYLFSLVAEVQFHV